MEQDILQPLYDYMNLFTRLGEGDMLLISKQIKYRKVSAGEVLLSKGQIARDLYFVVNGVLKTVVENNKGEKVIKHFHNERQFCTDLRSFHLARRGVEATESIVAACDSEIIVISHIGMDQLVILMPHYRELFNTAIAVQLADNEKAKKELLSDSETCYRRFLIRKPDIAFRVPMTDIMSYLEIPEHYLRRLKAFVF